MSAYWVEFAGHTPGCVETKPGEDVATVAKAITGCEITRIDGLPYPAEPRLNKVDYGGGSCPSFCYTPRECRGRGSCPKNYACSE